VSPREPGRRRSRRARRVLIAALILTALHARGGALAAPQHEDAGTPRIEESSDALKVTSVIQCACGGCVNQTLHDCTCGFAAAERQRVEAALKAGGTPEAIIASYVAEHGPQIRIVPEKTGLHLIGWAIPFAAAAIGVVSLTALLLGWRRRTMAEGAQPAPLPAEVDRRYRDRLDRDLKEMDRW
jgi:cytochrome c-type biogenesis protein CcmH/NrfF